MCGTVFCKHCPKFVRNVAICPLCGDLCREYRVVAEKVARAELQRSGFGINDFFSALSYPLQHMSALFIGALIYGFSLLVGATASLVAWMVMFGCISQTINYVAVGRFDRSFMSGFEFSDREDVFGPIFLGLGITIVTWGPMIVFVGALLSGVVSVGSLDASDPVTLLVDLLPYIPARTPIGVLFLLCLGWGLFYYPMALTVAGYTQSFSSVVNPLVGLDTIRRMGTTYFKAFAMVIVVQFIGLAGGAIPFAGPFIGGNFITAIFTFYFNLAIACILGRSLFKCADRLDIHVD